MTVYAYYLPETKEADIVFSWAECEKKVKGVNARHKKHDSEDLALAWLEQVKNNNGKINYTKQSNIKSTPTVILEPGIYCDSGTGRGYTEARVTNEKKHNLLYHIYDSKTLNENGNYTVRGTNNKGELTALYLALLYAIKSEIVFNIYSDSQLIINYWSLGRFNDEIDNTTKGLISLVVSLRKKHEARGGKILYISGDDNPADLGFHKKKKQKTTN